MPGVDVTENYIRIRQKDPGLFEKGSFRTITLKSGIRAVVGRLKGKKTTSIQTLLFDKKKYDVSQARAWVKSNVHKYSEEKIIQVKNKMEFSKAMTYLDEVYFAEKGRWTRQYINDLPDSAFAIILPGGKKDEDGKTVPRSLRKLPYKDASGNVDLPHLRNALARVNQPGTDLTPEQRSKAKSILLRTSKKYLKTYKEKKSEQMATDEFEEFELSKFQEEDIYSRLQSLAEKLEAVKTIEEVKPIVTELKELIKTEEEDENGEEKEETGKEEEGKEIQEIKPETEKQEEVKVVENADNSQVSEALKLNEKILTALKESEDESEKLKKELQDNKIRFSEQIDILNKINEKYKSDFDDLAETTIGFVSVINEQQRIKFAEKVEKVLYDYCKFMHIPESEIADVRQTMSKWSEDMLEQTAKAISAKRTKMAEKEPVVLTTSSSTLRESVSFSEREWNEMTPEEKTNHLHKMLLEQNKQ